MADIFFSYKSDERDRVVPIVERLEAAGWSVFWDRKTPVGTTWSAFIKGNLKQAKCVLVVWSDASVESHWVEIEAGKGRDRGCLVPLKLDDVEPPFGFEHIQAADFTRWTGDTNATEWQDLIAAVERCVPRSSVGNADTATNRSAPTLHPEKFSGNKPESDPPSSPPDPDLSQHWERLLANPSLDQLEQLAEEVTAMRLVDARSPGLITLQRRASAALDAARQATPPAPAGAPPPKSGNRFVWVWVAAGIIALAATWFFMRTGPGKTQPHPPPETAGKSTNIPLPELVEIPKGCFEMGSPSGMGSGDEEPQHRVCLEAFHIGRHEVTFDQFDAFARADERELPSDEGYGRGKRPVINVSWPDAQDYVRWLSNRTDQTCSLPSEAQWEYAARAGTTAEFALPAPNGSDDIAGKGLANCNGCGTQWDNKKTAPVGSFKANAWGLHDMHGNVWEWVQDRYHESYQGAPADGSAWEESGSDDAARRLRGGSWGGNPYSARSAFRYRADPGHRLRLFGFRVLCSGPIAVH